MFGEKKILVINTASTGLTGITSVMRNLSWATKDQVKYAFVLNSIIDKGVEQSMRLEYGKIYVAPISRVKHPLSYYRWLKIVITSGHYDAVHVHGNSGTMYIEIHAAKKAGIPIRIAHSHSSSCKYQVAHRVLKPLLNHEMTTAISCSEMAGSWLFSKEYQVIDNGIKIDDFMFSEEKRNEYRDALQLQKNFVVGHIGYFEKVKNQIFIVKVFAEVIKKRPEARLLLIGDGSLKESIVELAKELDIARSVMLLGNRNDVSNLYQAMDIFTLPSLYEGLPVTLIEAQSSGLDCITSENVTKEANVTGNVFYHSIDEPADIDRWAKILINYKIPNDRKERAQVMRDSRFNIQTSAKELLKIYGVG